MSRSSLALVHEADAAKSSLAGKASGVRVSHPGDASELEADRVADTVSQGGKVAGWSLSASSFDGVHRQAAPQPPASPTEIAGKVAEALLATPAGKKALDSVTSVLTSPAGLVITGSTAIGIFSALGKAGKPLPAQLPAIPLDFIRPGLTVKLTWNGPVNQPTDGSISISYSPKAAEKNPTQSATEKQRAENATMAADQAKLHPGPQEKPAVGPLANSSKKSLTDRMFEKWQMEKLAAIGNFAKPKAVLPGASTPPVQTPALEKSPEVKHAPIPAPAQAPAHEAAKHDAAKKEEIPVQRKAEAAGPISTGSASVDSVLRSSGQPLDRATRRDMESRIGFDFSHVRLHTDARAGESAQQLSAKAYTVGSNVVFAPGRFAPHSSEGRHLLAHELTHVVQQTSSPERSHPAARPVARHIQRSWSAMDLPGAGWVIDKVRGLRGYKLVCTLVGHDLFDDSQVYERNASTVAQGILELIPYGNDLYEKLSKAGRAVEKAYHWLEAEFRKRNLTVDGIYDVLDRAVHAFSGWHPIASGEDVVAILMEPINQLIDLAGVIGKKVLEFILEGVVATFGETGQKVWAFFQRAGSVIARIAAHPLQFGMNLLKAVGEGFKNFFANIWDHLKTGVKTWVYEELDLPKDIKMPVDFTLGSMFKLLLQVLGLTWEHRRPQLVEKLQPIGGETVVYFFETIADKAGDVIKRIKEHGFSAIKEMIVEQAGEIFNTLVDSLKSWIATEFITRGLKLIAELSNPAGELIKIVESIIDTVMFVIEKAKQLADLINTVVNALSDIVEGKTGPAAKKVEDVLARSIPLLLRFIAGQFGLSGIGKKIRDIIHKIRDPIDKLIGRLLDVLVEKIKPLWDKGRDFFTAKLAAVKDWWLKPRKFHYGEEEHEVVVKGTAQKPEVFVHSAEEKSLDAFLTDAHATPAQKQQIHATEKGLTHKEGEKQTPAEDEAGAKKFDHLADQMDKLKPQVIPPLPDVKDGGTNTLGGGIYTEAYLQKGVKPGTGTSGAKDEPIIEDLGVLRPRNQKFYVKGHLLNQGLGGLGEWKNLMPITNTVNSRMRSWLEAPLKKAVANMDGSKAYWYRVDAKYDLGVDINKIDSTSTKSPALQKAELAETRLVSLSWKTRMATWTKEQGWKPNENELVDAKGTPLAEDKPKKLREDNFTPPTER
jgi:hypothetical protein